LMHRFSGNGVVFVEIDGSAMEYEIAAGDRKIVDTGYVAVMDESCSLDIRQVKGVKNMLFGGEGLFNTEISGPGRVLLQTMPCSKTAMLLYQYMPHPSSN
ncbi:MAG: AIM24 family protein, partial [Oscillospiraceae bacterium]|nr:AIM24 family protein [Oscillospiraceae bacterium]